MRFIASFLFAVVVVFAPATPATSQEDDDVSVALRTLAAIDIGDYYRWSNLQHRLYYAALLGVNQAILAEPDHPLVSAWFGEGVLVKDTGAVVSAGDAMAVRVSVDFESGPQLPIESVWLFEYVFGLQLGANQGLYNGCSARRVLALDSAEVYPAKDRALYAAYRASATLGALSLGAHGAYLPRILTGREARRGQWMHVLRAEIGISALLLNGGFDGVEAASFAERYRSPVDQSRVREREVINALDTFDPEIRKQVQDAQPFVSWFAPALKMTQEKALAHFCGL